MRRRLLLSCVALVAIVVVVVASLPLWLGVAVGRVGPAYGLTFSRYERLGYGRFALHEVEVRRGQTSVTLTRAEADTPVVWLWHRWTRQPNSVVGDSWTVKVDRRPETGASASGTPRPRGWVPLRGLLRRIADRLDHWLPTARVGAGTVGWPGGHLALAWAAWAGRELTVGGLVYRAASVDGSLAFPADADELRLAVRMAGELNSATLVSRANAIGGELSWWEQDATVDARFGESGWRPRQASFLAESWNIPGARLQIGELYAGLRGHARIDWREDRFVADIAFQGDPVPGRQAVPPLEVNLKGGGDDLAVRIDALHATLPGIKAQLSEPVTIGRDGNFRQGAALIAIEADLAQQPWFAGEGQVRGEARLVSGAVKPPDVEFQVDARNVAAQGFAWSAINARGRFRWPRLTVESGAVVGEQGERLDVRGGWDFRTRTILAAVVEGRIRRHSLARWLPDQPEFDAVALKAEIAGAVADPEHSGSAEARELKVPGMAPVTAALAWRGRGSAIEAFTSRVDAGSSSLAAAGSADRGAIHLDRLEFRQANALRLQLTEKATVRWRPALQIESLHLAGPEAGLEGSGVWGDAGKVELAVRNFESSWLDELMSSPQPKWRLASLAVTGSWDRGPMSFSLRGEAEVRLNDSHSAAIRVVARGDKAGVQVEALRVAEGAATVLDATGNMPVVLRPRGRPFFQIDTGGAIAIDATTAPHAAFWAELSSAAGIELKEPQATVHLGGTWLKPEGTFRLRATRIAMDAGRFKRPIPDLEKLDIHISGDRSGVRLETFSMDVQGQPIRAEGRLPIPDGRWSEVYKQPLATARRDADVRLEVPDADVAAFARFLPAYVAPKGRLQVDVAYKGGTLDGFLRLRDAASRPLGPLGVLQEVSADVRMTGQRFDLREVTAKSGGQAVTLTGKIEVPSGGRPLYDLLLRGDNLPLVRQAGLLLRGNLDLKLQSQPAGEPRISGSVHLRDSLFLSDLRSFLPEGGARATRRPPYFAIETPPLNAWSLAIELTADRFLRLRTPVFSGVASAHFRLSGTLGEPRAIGEATVDEGMVMMPFASFEIRQGAVRLTQADPFEPTVFIRGVGRRFGYDLHLEVEGAAASPNVALSSSPALDSEQLLEMVMTGAPPSNEINYSTTQRVTRFGAFLGQSLLGSLGMDTANADRLSILSGEKISRLGKETYEIEYKLSDRLKASGEYTEFDEYIGGIKWRVFPRKRGREAVHEAAK